MAIYENDLGFDFFDIASILGLQINPNKKNVDIPCPKCGGKKLGMNPHSGTGFGHCWHCDFNPTGVSYYAAVKEISNGEAIKEIKSILGLESPTTQKWLEEARRARKEREVLKIATQKPMAPIATLDRTYRAFLSKLTLSQKNRDNLLARGFLPEDIERLGYKTFPNKSNVDFFKLCKELELEGCTLEGVPGFYQAKTGAWTFVPMTQGIIIPQRTVNNLIFGFQIRKDDDLRTYDEETGKLEGKCTWFSSGGCRGGCGVQADINFSCDFKFDKKTGKQWIYSKNHKIVLTEGTMKADLVHCLEPDIPVMSVAGVNNTTYLEKTLGYLKKLGIDTVILAYDMDYKSNPNVQNALEKTRQMIEQSGMNYKNWTWDTTVEIDGKKYDLLKGLDDYLSRVKRGIIPKLKDLD